jgi:hypothetical protein
VSIDYYSCKHCGSTFNDCGDYVSCDCGEVWCSDKCAKKDGYKYSSRKGESSCKFCREEDFEDEKLLKFALKILNMKRKDLIEKYKLTIK